ncbi:hypothetical protein A6V39_00995 [Candidatus Mycoplasma haematobovis]|uniref:Uncharacterized protein n=2 Tax=Candidatus Mycoplasma haematobovis TaxID=432608 RepID=A0A1A9QFY1_9MOLU|nr:hypothetical protein A6V39_00995 [Candidatus Mycoplasma haematobovis]
MGTYLEAQGYTPLFNAKKEGFTKWKRNYLIYKDELRQLIPELEDSDKHGGFLLKQWCRVRLNQPFSKENYYYFDLTKKYCTMNIQNTILEEDDIRTIDEIPIEKQKELFNNPEQLLSQCKDWFRIPYTYQNYELFTKTKKTCATKNWI